MGLMIALYLYGGAGALVALAFLGWGIGRIDPAARGAWLVRPLLVPGVVLLWPLMLARWIVLVRRGQGT